MPRTMRDRIFSVGVTCVGRGMILRDRMLGRPAKAYGEPGPVRYWIPSGENFLDALLMEPSGLPARASVLICHGIGETVEHWRAVQVLLVKHGVTSLVFDYSGYGRSSGRVDARQWERDAREAFCFLQRRVGGAGVSVLGYSLGSGVAAALAEMVPTQRLTLCAAFASLRKAARCSGVPEFVAKWLPDIWDNEAALRMIEVPVMLVHGEEDALFPASIAKGLAASCGSPCELVVVSGVSHNSPIYAPGMDFWGEVIERL